jgi:molybdenum cofactor guanylyltransferase
VNPTVSGIVLAGGQSRRMGGGDKALKPLGGKPMLRHVIGRIAPQVEGLAINANGDPARLAAFGLPVIADTIDGFAGPLAGVLAGMAWAAARERPASHIVTVASDTPFFPDDLVARFLDAAGGVPTRIILAASGGNRHPVFGLWPVALKDDLAKWMAGTETYKVLAWVALHDWAACPFPLRSVGGRIVDPFFNANTPEEFAEAESILKEMAA